MATDNARKTPATNSVLVTVFVGFLLIVLSVGYLWGIVWGLLIFLFTWWLYIRQISVGQSTLVGKVYPYYTISPLGSLLGLIYEIRVKPWL